MISSGIKILLIPFVSYGYARLLLNLEVDFDFSNFQWKDLELGTFLTHVIVSYLTYLFGWIACALSSWTFYIPMLLATPVSFAWYVYNVEINEIFLFVDEDFDDHEFHYILFIVASLLWISQFLAFTYHLFQRPDKVLTRDSDLFWMPRYNSVFLEQYLVLNRKNEISGPVHVDKTTGKFKKFPQKILSRKNQVFICSTMYHETEEEMKQLMKSIKQIAEAGLEDTRQHTFESHIFFDNACAGERLNQWALQLLGLLQDTLGIEEVNTPKIITPYGIQLRYKLNKTMPFYIHLKDNNKVKNKKRWSQVMYMSYVLNYRMKNHNKDKAFILTTDADVEFTSGSVVALLDILARDGKAGAVCARTHPLGTGPIVWYQKFDYAIGHWFQKAAEHIVGCVLCCPGCFSVFRVSALEQVLETYSSNVEDGFDFLTKDMGEDRWLCTLLIQKGWRLEYSAVSQDYTFCPDTFEEFYKQRRRWIPSTIANLALVIDNWKKITSNNNSITILFILYQLLIVFSSLLSPATVILIIVSGIKALDHTANELALIIVLSIISALYGVICIYATEKTQIGVAKILTLVFSIIMAVVVSGILSVTLDGIITGNELTHINQTNEDFQFPVDINTIYTGLFAVTFLVAGILHLNEFVCLLHFIWYLLCLPSGYLFLIIYSVCNLNNRSWGTREGIKPKASHNSESWLDYFFEKWSSFCGFLSKCFSKMRLKDPNPESVTEDVDHSNASDFDQTVGKPEMYDEVKNWLNDNMCYVRK